MKDGHITAVESLRQDDDPGLIVQSRIAVRGKGQAKRA